MSTYNAADVLPGCLDSIKAQTCPHLEVIVADRASTDGTLDILREYEGKLNLRWASEPDKSFCDAWSKALPRASGDWLQFLGADDRLHHPESMARAAERLLDVPARGAPAAQHAQGGGGMSYASMVEQHRRRAILGHLAGCADYTSNDEILFDVVNGLGITTSRDQLAASLAWLAEAALLTQEQADGDLTLLRATARGADVAAGRAHHPGVRRSTPKEWGMSYASMVEQHRRRAILGHLAGCADYTSNDAILFDVVNGLGITTSRDQLAASLAWLAEAALLTQEQASGDLTLLRATARGADVAVGRTHHPGVRRSTPKGGGMTYASMVEQHRRRAILVHLAGCKDYTSNDEILFDVVNGLGITTSRDQLAASLAWLAEAVLLTQEQAGGDLTILRATARGADVAAGWAHHPRVRRSTSKGGGMSYASMVEQHRRRAILGHLASCADYTSNDEILFDVVNVLGITTSRDQLAAGLSWLAEAALLTQSQAGGDLTLLRATARGADVAAGRAHHPGVRRSISKGWRMSYASMVEQHRRRAILGHLAGCADYTSNDEILFDVVNGLCITTSRDQLAASLAWLAEAALLTQSQAGGDLALLRATARGADVAAGRAHHPGVRRTTPREWSMSYASMVEQHRRRAILGHLAGCMDYTSNDEILFDVVNGLGITTSRDQLAASLSWLAEAALLTQEQASGDLALLRATARGADVAAGRAHHPGVRRTTPRG